MIFINRMKNLKIYRTPVFLPTVEKDKKRYSNILLMTPNYESSKNIMTSSLFVNRLRYSSYYIKRDVSYYINNDKAEPIEESYLTESSVQESELYTDYLLKYLPESCINMGDKVLFFNEDVNDTQLYKMIYKNRMKTRKEIIELYNQVKNDLPFIKFTFPEIDKYKSRNLFVDLYFYNKLFFENNTWIYNKGMNLYIRFMTRLLNDPSINAAGYKKSTIIIPVTDWCKDQFVWNYKKFLNPMSVIFYLMNSGMESQLKTLFGNRDILFTSSKNYFKINFSEIETDEIKKLAIKFKLFLIKMVKNEEFDEEDIDSTADNSESSDVIKANIIDKIELAKGIDLTAQVANNKDNKKVTDIVQTNANIKASKEKLKKDVVDDSNVSKLSLSKPDTESIRKQANINKLADAIDTAGDNADSEDDAWDDLDNDEIKQIITDLDSDEDDSPDISLGRSSRITELDKKLMETEIKGKSIKDILEPKEERKKESISLNLSTPNEEWKDLSFVKFDQNYDIDRDIIRCFKHFEKAVRPVSIRNISVEDNSTSEDRVELYTVEMEDYRGKRFTIKLDIPIMVDNRFLLRGNNKSIQTQFFNMPIIKTETDTCQIISNYMKIFVYKFGSGAGKSLPITSKFIKAAKKYKGRKIKFITGYNTIVCNKYELPIDYVDLASTFSYIETDEFTIYFNQDEIRNKYIIDDTKGIPYGFDKKNKIIIYFNSDESFVDHLINLFEEYGHNDFVEGIHKATAPRICAYSRCSILDSKIPLVLICAYHEGLRKVLQKANITYEIKSSLTKEDRAIGTDFIKFADGYLVYKSTYESSLLLNGLKACGTATVSITDIDSKNTYLEFLDKFGGRIKADGLENFYDLMVDPMTEDSLKFYKMPTDYVSILLYANALLCDNKFIKHTNTSSRRLRRYILIAVYTYKVLSDAYALYANQLRHSRNSATMLVSQSAVIDKFLTDSITSDDSCINALRDVETTNSITTKGPSGMNSDRAYSLDKRTYDESMLNILGMSTGFAGNVGITRQSTIDASVDQNGYTVPINGDTSKMNTSKTLTITEALTPFGATHDDPMRTAMTFIQTAKHNVRTESSDPLLVTNGSDEALAYLTTNQFAFKAKMNGKVEEFVEDEYVLIAYDDGTKEYISLKEKIEKNSDGGYYVPIKLSAVTGLKVGSAISANQIVAYDKYSFSNSVGESDNLAYNIGKLAKIAIINTDEGFEDSGVITERMSQKLATRIDLQYSATLDKKTNILSMLKVGDKVEAGDPLMMWQSPFDDEDANALMKTLAADDVSELGKKKLKTEVTGVITAIKIYRTIELDDMSESMRAYVEEYEKPLKELAEKLKENNLSVSQVPAHYKLNPTGKLKKAQDAILVEYFVEYLDTVGVGDKIVYFAANKAVEKNVIPLGKEPYTDFRPHEPIDAFVSQVSIDKRIVTSTLIIGSLQKLMIELDRSVKDIMDIPYDDSTV